MTKVVSNGQTMGRYWYDGGGKRIKKIEDSKTTIYIYSGIKVIYEKVLETGVETKYIGSLAKIENGITTFYHVDHLGSTRQMTDSSGNALFTDYLIYKPFGEIYSGSAGDERYLFNGKEKVKHFVQVIELSFWDFFIWIFRALLLSYVYVKRRKKLFLIL